jgi:hypothetical protein
MDAPVRQEVMGTLIFPRKNLNKKNSIGQDIAGLAKFVDTVLNPTQVNW